VIDYIFLKSLHKGANYIILTKEGMKERIYNDELLKFLFTFKSGKFQGSTAENKFAELFRKEEGKHTRLQMA